MLPFVPSGTWDSRALSLMGYAQRVYCGAGGRPLAGQPPCELILYSRSSRYVPYARAGASSTFSTELVTGSGCKVQPLWHMESLSCASHNMLMSSGKDTKSVSLDTEKRHAHTITLTKRYAHTVKSRPCHRRTYY